jgi:hypothetical protein
MEPDVHRIPWSWLKAFYVLPLLGACLLTGLLWRLRSEHRGGRMFAWGWGLGWPCGSVLWIGLWYLWGGASGLPEFGVIALALAGWFAWSAGLYLSSSEKFWGLGATICLFTFTMLLAIRSTEPHGTGLVSLDIAGALIALPPYFKARGSKRVADSIQLSPA